MISCGWSLCSWLIKEYNGNVCLVCFSSYGLLDIAKSMLYLIANPNFNSPNNDFGIIQDGERLEVMTKRVLAGLLVRRGHAKMPPNRAWCEWAAERGFRVEDLGDDDSAIDAKLVALSASLPSQDSIPDDVEVAYGWPLIWNLPIMSRDVKVAANILLALEPAQCRKQRHRRSAVVAFFPKYDSVVCKDPLLCPWPIKQLRPYRPLWIWIHVVRFSAHPTNNRRTSRNHVSLSLLLQRNPRNRFPSVRIRGAIP